MTRQRTESARDYRGDPTARPRSQRGRPGRRWPAWDRCRRPLPLLGALALALACDAAGPGADAAGPGADGGDAGVGSAVEAAPAAGSVPVQLQDLSFVIPEGWQSEAPQSSMRLAQYRIPGAAGDASLVIFRFPGGGSARANIERWVAQFEALGGGSAREAATVTEEQRGAIQLTALDVRGRFGGQQMPNAPAQPAIEDARMLALVVEGADAPFFFKLVGPAETVNGAADAWQALIASVEQG